MIGRFAPSPTGRMHLGNLFAALLSWLDTKSQGGLWLLRHEDIDPQRSRPEYALQIEEDLAWLGLYPDSTPVYQSRRSHIYEAALQQLISSGLVYACTCRRADLLAVGAPHASDGRPIYGGRCRPASLPTPLQPPQERHSLRLAVEQGEVVEFIDGVFGPQHFSLAQECGDFIVRRADGAWAYQLAVVADDADMGITTVVRGCDLLPSAAQQIYIYRLLGLTPPEFVHIPLLCNPAGQRLSKRDASLDLAALRSRYSPQGLCGLLASLAGLLHKPEPISPKELLPLYHRPSPQHQLQIDLHI